MTPVDASNNLEIDASNILVLRILNLNLNLVIMLEMQLNVISSSRDTLLIGIENCLKLMKF